MSRLAIAALLLATTCLAACGRPQPAAPVPGRARAAGPVLARALPGPSVPRTIVADADGDGFIDRSEAMLRRYFFAGEWSHTIGERRKRVLARHAAADRDGDGRVSIAEFQHGPAWEGLTIYAIDPINLEILRRDFALGDLDEDKRLTPDELVATNQPSAMAWLEGPARAQLAAEVIAGFDFSQDGSLSEHEWLGTWCDGYLGQDLGDW